MQLFFLMRCRTFLCLWLFKVLTVTSLSVKTGFHDVLADTKWHQASSLLTWLHGMRLQSELAPIPEVIALSNKDPSLWTLALHDFCSTWLGGSPVLWAQGWALSVASMNEAAVKRTDQKIQAPILNISSEGITGNKNLQKDILEYLYLWQRAFLKEREQTFPCARLSLPQTEGTKEQDFHAPHRCSQMQVYICSSHQKYYFKISHSNSSYVCTKTQIKVTWKHQKPKS